ncbi:pitrilysin family protein [Mycoplasmatota bacterium WC30]
MIKKQALIDEFIYEETLKSGLKVAIHPKKNFKKTLVSLQVNFGGIDVCYKYDNKIKTIPTGVAHFLEHSLFTNNGRNLAEEFSKYGASINAYTSKSITAYKFNCIDNLEYLLGYFLESFVKPKFSEVSIEKEKRIIEHELNMSDDSIHQDLHRKLKRLMYTDLGIYSDVGGTVKDVKTINGPLLDDVFSTFYHPMNMSLTITGDVDQEKIIEQIRNHSYNQNDWPEYKVIERIITDSKRTTHNYKKAIPLNDTNIISYGIKIPSHIFKTYDKEFIHIAIGTIISNAFGLASKNFDIMKRQKLMNVSFSANSIIERDYGFINIYIQTEQVKKYVKTIEEMILNIGRLPLDEELFDLDKKMIMGNYIIVFDSLSRIHDFLCNCICEDINIETYLDQVLNIKIEDIEPIKALFSKENIYSIRYLKALK